MAIFTNYASLYVATTNHAYHAFLPSVDTIISQYDMVSVIVLDTCQLQQLCQLGSSVLHLIRQLMCDAITLLQGPQPYSELLLSEYDSHGTDLGCYFCRVKLGLICWAAKFAVGTLNTFVCPTCHMVRLGSISASRLLNIDRTSAFFPALVAAASHMRPIEFKPWTDKPHSRRGPWGKSKYRFSMEGVMVALFECQALKKGAQAGSVVSEAVMEKFGGKRNLDEFKYVFVTEYLAINLDNLPTTGVLGQVHKVYEMLRAKFSDMEFKINGPYMAIIYMF